jgi:hypothetical protein
MLKTKGDRSMAEKSEFGPLNRINSRDTASWQADAQCLQADPEVFFVERGGAGMRDARKICAQCTVGRKCLQFALEGKIESGVFGGMSPVERKKLLNADREQVDRAFLAARQRNKSLR